VIEKFLTKHNLRLTRKGQNLIDNIQGIGMALLILLVFVLVGSIEASGR
jgi:hypothetical protein